MTKVRLAAWAGKAGRVAIAAAMALALAPAVALTAPAEEAQALSVTAADGTKWECTPYKEEVKDATESATVGLCVTYMDGGGPDIKIPQTFAWGDKQLPVKEISGFKNNTELKSVSVPETCVSISFSAFSGCTSLTAVNGLKNVMNISSGAFRNCSSLKSLDLNEEKVENIDANAFANCSYTFDSPYLEECWDGGRSLAVEATLEGYKYRAAAAEAIKLINVERARSGAGPVTADYAMTMYAEQRTMQQFLGQTHSQVAFVDFVSSGRGSYTELAGDSIWDGDAGSLTSPNNTNIAKEVVGAVCADLAHRLPLLAKENKYIGIGIFRDKHNGNLMTAIQLTDDDGLRGIGHTEVQNSFWTTNAQYSKKSYKVRVQSRPIDYSEGRQGVRFCASNQYVVMKKNDFDVETYFEASGVKWCSSDSSVATVSKTSGYRARVKLHKAGKFTITCTWPTTRGKEISYSMEYTSKKNTWQPVTCTDSNGTVYKQTAKGKKTMTVSGLTEKAKGKSAVSIVDEVTVNGTRYTVTGLAKTALKGSKAKTIKLVRCTPKVAKGALAGTKVKTIKLTCGKYKFGQIYGYAPSGRSWVKKTLGKQFSKKNCGKSVKISICK